MIQFAYFCVIGEQLFHGLSRTYVSWTLQNPKLCGRSDLLFSFSLFLSRGDGVCVWGGGESVQILERDVRLKKERKKEEKKKG